METDGFILSKSAKFSSFPGAKTVVQWGWEGKTMEVKEKIETRVLRTAAGRTLRMDYCLVAQMEESHRLTGPYGLEIVLTGREGTWRERCSNLTEDYRRAVALIHVFAANGVTPVGMLEVLRE